MGKTEPNKDKAEDAEEIDRLECTSLILANCSAFVAITLIIVGELMHEQNSWGVLVVGGGLCTLNVLQTSYRMERHCNKEKKGKTQLSPGSSNTKEVPHRTQVYVGDAVSIDMDNLSEEVYQDEQRYDYRDRTPDDFIDTENNVLLDQHHKPRKSDRRYSDRKHYNRRRDQNDKDGNERPERANEDDPHLRKHRRKRKSKSKALGRGIDQSEIAERKGKKMKKKSKRRPRVRLAEKHTIIDV